MNRIYNCPDYDYIDYSGNTFFGMFDYSTRPEKTFTSLPPHWSLSVRLDLLLFASLDATDSGDILIDSVL